MSATTTPVDMKINFSKVFAPLPPALGGSTNPQEECKIEKVEEFLKKNVPTSDQKEIEGILSRPLPLHKQFKKQNGNGNKPEKRRRKRLTAREKRDLNLYKVKKDTLKFQSFKKLHYLWKDYMREIIDFDSLNSVKSKDNIRHHPLEEFGGRIKAILDEPLQLKVCRADLHGCYLKVSKALNACLVGIQGIVVMETRNTLQIINKKNTLLTVPKHGSSFRLVLKFRDTELLLYLTIFLNHYITGVIQFHEFFLHHFACTNVFVLLSLLTFF